MQRLCPQINPEFFTLVRYFIDTTLMVLLGHRRVIFLCSKLMDLMCERSIFFLIENKAIFENSIRKLVKLRSLAAKCCKIENIQPCKVANFVYSCFTAAEACNHSMCSRILYASINFGPCQRKFALTHALNLQEPWRLFTVFTRIFPVFPKCATKKTLGTRFLQ